MSADGVTAPVPAGSDGRPLRSAVVAVPFALGAAAFALVALPLDEALVAAIAGAALIVLAAIDIEQRIIPNRIVLPAAAIVLVVNLALSPGHAAEWILAPLAVAVVLMIPQLLGRAWMGMGDVKLALLLGAALGWGVVGALLLSFVLVLPVAIVLLFRGGLEARKAMIPFGPFMALAGLIVLFVPTLVVS